MRCIADRSEYRWRVVAGYEANNLASGREDENCLEKAEKAAERKANRKREAAVGASIQSAGAKPAKNSAGNVLPLPTNKFLVGGPSQQFPLRPQLRLGHVIGLCFLCGEKGHLKRSCTKSAPVLSEVVS